MESDGMNVGLHGSNVSENGNGETELIFQMASLIKVHFIWPASISNLRMFFSNRSVVGTRSSCWVALFKDPPPLTPLSLWTPIACMSAGEIRLRCIPSCMSSVLIISRHNTPCSPLSRQTVLTYCGGWNGIRYILFLLKTLIEFIAFGWMRITTTDSWWFPTWTGTAAKDGDV